METRKVMAKEPERDRFAFARKEVLVSLLGAACAPHGTGTTNEVPYWTDSGSEIENDCRRLFGGFYFSDLLHQSREVNIQDAKLSLTGVSGHGNRARIRLEACGESVEVSIEPGETKTVNLAGTDLDVAVESLGDNGGVLKAGVKVLPVHRCALDKLEQDSVHAAGDWNLLEQQVTAADR
jgi:hypothetical protein